MKDNNLHKAIKDLPEIKAPNIWNKIEEHLNPKNNRKRFILIILLLIFSSIPTYIGINNFNRKKINKSENTIVSEKKISNIINNNSPVYHDKSQKTREIIEHTYENSTKHISKDIDKNNINTRVIKTKKLEIINQDSTLITKLENRTDEKTIIQTKLIIIGDNKVNNPGFENYRKCPKSWIDKPTKTLIPYWDVPTKGTPDYFNSCSRHKAGVPENFAGKIHAKIGNSYAGIILRQNFTMDNRVTGEKPKIYREYIQTELKTELEEGKSYRVKFWICNSSNSRYAVDAVGAVLSSKKIGNKTNELLYAVPTIENDFGKFITNQNYWIAIEGIYTAKGGERYLTIGNFKNNFNTRYIMQNGKSDFNYAYYYIDDVSVHEVYESAELSKQ
jgi:hypothetical protein